MSPPQSHRRLWIDIVHSKPLWEDGWHSVPITSQSECTGMKHFDTIGGRGDNPFPPENLVVGYSMLPDRLDDFHRRIDQISRTYQPHSVC
jgi:hypothetical protein